MENPYVSSSELGAPIVLKDNLSMNQNTLWFIAKNLLNNPRKPRDQPGDTGGCFNCGSNDHWARECPEGKPVLAPLMRTWEDCGIKHLF